MNVFAQNVDPTAALSSIETALRLVIRDVLGAEEWVNAQGAPDASKLAERRTEEEKRRDGAATSNNLLDYTETYHLTSLIEKNWDKFQVVFKDKNRTMAYFGIIGDVRNSIAHSRDLVPFERDLISGIAGQLRNQVTLFRSASNQSSKYYPLIESVTDNFGTEGSEWGSAHQSARLEVGEVLTFTGTAFNAKGGTIIWQAMPVTNQIFRTVDDAVIEVAEGDSATFDYTVKESDVNESFGITIRITTGSRYHRYMNEGRIHFDDRRIFYYAVNPPEKS